jgi:hypothetical protein
MKINSFTLIIVLVIVMLAAGIFYERRIKFKPSEGDSPVC